MKPADKTLRQAALAKVRAGFNSTAASMNEGSAALALYSSEYQPAVKAFNQVVAALNVAGPVIRKAIAETNAIVTEGVPEVKPWHLTVKQIVRIKVDGDDTPLDEASRASLVALMP